MVYRGKLDAGISSFQDVLDCHPVCCSGLCQTALDNLEVGLKEDNPKVVVGRRESVSKRTGRHEIISVRPRLIHASSCLQVRNSLLSYNDAFNEREQSKIAGITIAKQSVFLEQSHDQATDHLIVPCSTASEAAFETNDKRNDTDNEDCRQYTTGHCVYSQTDR